MPTSPIETLRRLAEDERSGATKITLRAAAAVVRLETRRERVRAARLLVRAKPAMAPMWRLATLLVEDRSDEAIRAFATSLEEGQRIAARNARFLAAGRTPRTIVTWSNASVLPAAITELPVAEVRCARSGEHGRRLAAAVRRGGVRARIVDDAELLRALEDADLALIGADAIGARIANQTGSELTALAARSRDVPVYAIAAEAKLLPAALVDRFATGAFEAFDADRLDAVITEHGPRTPRKLASLGERIEIASQLLR